MHVYAISNAQPSNEHQRSVARRDREEHAACHGRIETHHQPHVALLMREPSSAIKRNLPRCEIDCAHSGDSMVWGWMCIQEGALKQMLSSYGCYSCRYRVRGHCQGTRSGGSEALEVSVAVEATAV